MKIVEPLQEPLFCWCVNFWIELPPWQNLMDPELICAMFIATIT